jgi:hypothetical protein
MSNYLAVRVGKKMPNDFQKMELRATCELNGCGAPWLPVGPVLSTFAVRNKTSPTGQPRGKQC